MKKLLSAFLIACMIVTSSIVAFGETTTTATITDGTLTLVGDATGDVSLLVDNFFFTFDEWIKKLVPNNGYDKSRPGGTVGKAKLVEFKTVGSGFQYDWGTEKTIDYLDLWIWRVGAIKAYEIFSSTDGQTWDKIATGTFDQTATGAEDRSSTSSFYYSAKFSPVTTKHLKFVITELRDQNSAYVAEVKYGSGSVNLTDTRPFGSSTVTHSPYVYRYRMSNNTGVPGNNFCYNNNLYSRSWAISPDTTTYYYLKPNEKNEVYYIVDFGSGMKQNINKIVVPFKFGYAKEVVVYTETKGDYDYQKNTGGTWTEVARVRGSFDKKNPAVVEIRSSDVNERLYKVEVNEWTRESVNSGGYTDELLIDTIQMYSGEALSNTAINAGDVKLADADGNAIKNITKDTKVSAVGAVAATGFPKDATMVIAQYSEDGMLLNVKIDNTSSYTDRSIQIVKSDMDITYDSATMANSYVKAFVIKDWTTLVPGGTAADSRQQ